MTRLDINACFGRWPHWEVPHTRPDDLVDLMDRNRIDRAACLSLRGLFLDWRAGNAETLAAAARYPERLIPMATIGPLFGPRADELNDVFDAGARGVRLFPSFHNYRLDDGFADDVCAVAAERELPVMIATRLMMSWRFPTLDIGAIGSVIERHPKTTFIMSGPNYLAEYESLVRLMKRCPNVVCEISCLQGFGSVGHLVGEVGAERVLFGTGAVLNYPACNVAKLDHATLSPEQRDMIAGGNGLRLLHLAGRDRSADA